MVEQAELLEYFDGNTGLLFEVEIFHSTQLGLELGPAKYRWHPLFNAAKVWLTPTTRVPCSNAPKTKNLLKLAGVPQTKKTISAAS